MISTAQQQVRAAQRLLQRASGELPLSVIECAAWRLGVAGLPLPEISDSKVELHAQLCALAATRNANAVISWLEQQLPKKAGEQLLLCACYYAGTWMPERLVALAERFPGIGINPAMLAKTSEPERLLALLSPQSVVLGLQAQAIGELVILGRDRGAPIEAAEKRWWQLLENPPKSDSRFINTWLRVRARDSLEGAIGDLIERASFLGRLEVNDGAVAVLARLLEKDPQRAVAVLTQDPDPWSQLDWVHTLVRGFVLPEPVTPIVHSLLAMKNSEIDITLARSLVWARASELLSQALVSIDAYTPIERAYELSPGIYHLRTAGHTDDAEQMRELVLPCLPESKVKVESQGRDVFEVISADGSPALDPWGAGSALP